MAEDTAKGKEQKIRPGKKACYSRFLPASAGKAGKHVTRGQLLLVLVTLYDSKACKWLS